MQLTAPALIDLPDGPGSTRACVQQAVLLARDARGAYVLLVRGAERHERAISVEVAGLATADAQAVHRELDALRDRLNVYRGKVLDVQATHAGLSLSFSDGPLIGRDQLVLPDPVLARIERHALDVAGHRAELLAAGQHLKRGILLYGPPGTGKTHTVRYLVGRLAGYTRLLLTGRSLHAVGAVTELARRLQPALVVLEDVDLVAEDRDHSRGGSTVLFDLLDAMDGAAPDADLLFLLTTNRADLLEPALATRPGRVDVAVEVGLPDSRSRRQLLLLYARGVPLRLSDDEVGEVVERCEGVTASFLKELLRRAVLEALTRENALRAVTMADVRAGLDDLLDSSHRVTRSLLGVGAPDSADAERSAQAELRQLPTRPGVSGVGYDQD